MLLYKGINCPFNGFKIEVAQKEKNVVFAVFVYKICYIAKEICIVLNRRFVDTSDKSYFKMQFDR